MFMDGGAMSPAVIEPELREPARFTWRALWAGFFVVLGSQIGLQLFGMAVGLSSASPNGSGRGLGLWTGIWAIIASVSAFFFGGMTAAAVARPLRRSEAVLSGVVVWALGLTAFAVLNGPFEIIRIARTMLMPPGAMNARAYEIGGAWVAFGTVLLALGGAIVGSVIAAGERRRREPRRTVVIERPPGAPTTTPAA
jgi:hypothetical protein